MLHKLIQELIAGNPLQHRSARDGDWNDDLAVNQHNTQGYSLAPSCSTAAGLQAASGIVNRT